MYLVGDDHPNKSEARRLVEQVIREGMMLVTDAEVYQELLHRYSAIRRLDGVAPAFELLDALVDEVVDIGRNDVISARDLLLTGPDISARDALHVAVMRRIDCRLILTFDRGYDGIPGISRLE